MQEAKKEEVLENIKRSLFLTSRYNCLFKQQSKHHLGKIVKQLDIMLLHHNLY